MLSLQANIAAALHTLIEAGAAFEIRIPEPERGYPVSGYFDDLDKAAAAASAWSGKCSGVYFTPNPVNPALLARADNRLRQGGTKKGSAATTDVDITRRCWLLIDLDPVRPAGISSTDAEHTAALAKAHSVRDWLAACGWPTPIHADSGNGAHLLYRVDLPNDADARALVENCLKALAARFDDPIGNGTQCPVKVDTGVFNASRIWKLYGTRACKGDPTAERPHRLACILYAPNHPVVVAVEQLRELAALAPQPDPKPKIERPTAPAGDFFTAVNQIALARLSDWVLALFPDAKSYRTGYRVTSKCLKRGFEEDLSIQADGIKDFGLHDQGDMHGGRRTPIDLVIEHGAASSPKDAALWLCRQLSIESAALGWKDRPQPPKEREIHSRTGKNKNDPTHPTLPSQSISYSYTLDDGTYTSYTADVPFLHDIDEDGELTLIESRVAERLADCLRGHFAFSREGSRWYAFTGTHWHAVQAGVLDELVTRMMYAGAIEGFAARRVPAILSLLAKGLLPLPEQRDSRLLPFTNGLLDLETRELTPTTPDNALIWCLPYAYDPRADCPSVKAWLLRAVDDDAETLEFLRAWLAALLTGRADLQKFLHLFGPAGTGKGVFTRLAELLIGRHNSTVTDLRNLEQNRFETASLYGKRLVSITDTSKYGGSVDVFKALTGQDSLRLERKHQQQGATFRFGGLVLLASNEALQTTDYTSALERRRLTVEFKRLVTDAERADWNARGGEEAVLHSEIAGVVNWCLALSRDEVTQRLTCQPQRVAQANREALRNGNPIADWLLENVIPQPGTSTQVGDHRPIYENGRTRYEYADVRLYPNYLQWCQRTKREALALRRFSGLAVDMARSLGVDVLKVRGNAGVALKGLRLRGEDETPHDWLGRVGSNVGSVGSVQDNSEKTPYNPLIVQEVQEVQDNSSFYLHKGDSSLSNTVDPQGFQPLATRILTTLRASPAGFTHDDLGRVVGNAKGASPPMIERTLMRLFKEGAVAKVNDRWVANSEVRHGARKTIINNVGDDLR